MNNEIYPNKLCNGYGVHCDGCEACNRAPVSAGTIDTPTLRMMLVEHRRAVRLPDQHRTLAAIVAHIDQHVAAAVAEAEKKHAARIVHLTHERDHARNCYTKLASLTGNPAATAPVSAVPLVTPDHDRAACAQCGAAGVHRCAASSAGAPVSAADDGGEK